jgi:hypothetical protein
MTDTKNLKHVFISYKHEEHSHSFVAQLIDKLRESDLEFWTDKHISGGREWRKEIDQALELAFAVIVVLTPESAISPYVTYEWAYAMGLGRTILPVLLDGSLSDLHPKIEPLQYHDFRKRKDPWKDLIEDLIKEKSRLLNQPNSDRDSYEATPKRTSALNKRDKKLLQDFVDLVPYKLIPYLRSAKLFESNDVFSVYDADFGYRLLYDRIIEIKDFCELPHFFVVEDQKLASMMRELALRIRFMRYEDTDEEALRSEGYDNPLFSHDQVQEAYLIFSRHVLEQYPDLFY